MATQFRVTATPSKNTYVQGETISITITGDAQPDPVTSAVDVSLVITAADGATGQLDTVVNVSRPSAAVAVVITSATDTEGRTYKVSADGKSVTAVA